MAVDTKAIVRILIRDRDKLFSYIWSLVGDIHLAEDVFQDLSLLAVEKGVEVADEPQLAVWLRRSARFKAMEILRKKNRGPLLLSDSVVDQLEVHWASLDGINESLMAEALKGCLGELTSNNRKIVTLRYYEGMQSAEIAAKLGRKASAIYQALTRIHNTLIDCVRYRLEIKPTI